MASVIQCDSLTVYSGLVGAYIRNGCGEEIATCAVSADLGSEVENQEYECNGQVYSLARLTNYTISLTVNFSLEAVSAVFGQDMLPVISNSGVTGQAVQLPTGTLPSNLNIVIITRTNTGKESHIRALGAEMSNFTISEFTRGSTVTMEYEFTVRNVEIVEWASPTAADSSPFLTALRPALSWRLCDCEDNQPIASPLFDETGHNVPLGFAQSPEFADNQVCCGIDLVAGSCFSADISTHPSAEWGFILLGEYSQSVTLLDAPMIDIVWDEPTSAITVTNSVGSLVVPFYGGSLAIGYSNDGIVLVNGVSYSGLPSDPTPSPAVFDTNCNTDNGTMISVNYFTRWINTSDVR